MASFSRTSSPNPAGSSVYQLKGEAQALQDAARARGETLQRSAALDAVARRHGFSDWNAAAAAAARSPQQSAKPGLHKFEDIASPLPKRALRLHPAGDKRNAALKELNRWAQQLEFIAEKVSALDRREAMDMIGGDRPYVFVLDRQRWPDGLFRLCDRGYEPFSGIALDAAELASLGLSAWEDLIGTHGGRDMFSVINDDVLETRDAAILKKAARLLVELVRLVDEQQDRDNEEGV